MIMKNPALSPLGAIKKTILAAAAAGTIAVPILLGLTTPRSVGAQASGTAKISAELRKPPPTDSTSMGARFKALLKERYPQLLRDKVVGTPVVSVLFGTDGSIERTSSEVFHGRPDEFIVTEPFFAERFGIPVDEVAYTNVQFVEIPSAQTGVLVASTERKNAHSATPFVSSIGAFPDTRAIDHALVERYFPLALRRPVPAQVLLWVLLGSDGRVLRTGQNGSSDPNYNHMLDGQFPGIDTQFVTITPVTDNDLRPVNDSSGKPVQLYCFWLKQGSQLPAGT